MPESHSRGASAAQNGNEIARGREKAEVFREWRDFQHGEGAMIQRGSACGFRDRARPEGARVDRWEKHRKNVVMVLVKRGQGTT
jgi:hypothetical protein